MRSAARGEIASSCRHASSPSCGSTFCSSQTVLRVNDTAAMRVAVWLSSIAAVFRATVGIPIDAGASRMWSRTKEFESTGTPTIMRPSASAGLISASASSCNSTEVGRRPAGGQCQGVHPGVLRSRRLPGQRGVRKSLHRRQSSRSGGGDDIVDASCSRRVVTPHSASAECAKRRENGNATERHHQGVPLLSPRPRKESLHLPSIHPEEQ